MGRSIVPIEEAPEFGPEPVRFEADGLLYESLRRDGRLIHRETKLDEDGRVVGQVEGVVRYALGSGTRGVSFLVEREGGALSQSPISWYTQGRRWDLAPSYRAINQHFERPILPECLFCHADRAEAVPGALNRYEVATAGHAIGCERCHGPGEDHVRLTGATDDDGRPTIVNPGALEPYLREAVCGQCHLQGEARVLRAGHSPEDFRPGRPFDEVFAVFVRPGGGTLRNRSIGHVEQMHASRCYRASEGRLGCISCHDPHAAPAPEEKAAYYRERCLACHQERGCSLPEPERLARQDDCAACHMPPSELTDIAHTAATLHHIPRSWEQVESEAPPDEDRGELVHFHEDRLTPALRATGPRDLGVALASRGRNLPDRRRAAELGRQALALLSGPLRAHPDDPEGWEAQSTAQHLIGREGSALDSLAEALKHQPDRDRALIQAATMAENLGRRDEARRYVERLLTLNPSRAQHHAILAVLNAHEGRWDEAATAARAALALNPAHGEARRVLIERARAMGLPERAAEQQRILDLYQSRSP
jgi:predicted CXXCH cytochrome family protein